MYLSEWPSNEGRMKFKQICNNIYWLDFKKQDEMCLSFCRLQEHYESPEFAGKIFTMEEYQAWYIKTYHMWSYMIDWAGFNVPDYVVRKFINGEFNPLTRLEEKLLDKLILGTKCKIYKPTPYYVIGTCNMKEKYALKHEIAHGLFYTNPEYTRNVINILNDNEFPYVRFVNWLIKKGYHLSTAFDELHAYAMDDFITSDKAFPNIKPWLKGINLLKENFNKFVDLKKI